MSNISHYTQNIEEIMETMERNVVLVYGIETVWLKWLMVIFHFVNLYDDVVDCGMS